MPIKVEALVGVLVLTLKLNATQAGSAVELSSTELYQRAVKSTLALEVTTVAGEHFVGAAFVVGEGEVAVTAWHLIQKASTIRGRLSDGTPVQVCHVGGEDELHDLALLLLSPTAAPPLPLNVKEPEIASRVYAIGSPRGYAFSVSDGLLSQVQWIDGFPQYQLSCPFSPGNSGGPVLNSAGEVIGVASWSKTGAQNVNFAIPAQFVADLCRTNVPAIARRPLDDPGAAKLGGTTTDTPPEAESVDEAFAKFRRFLSSLAGQRARVVVSSATVSDTFEFLVPSAPAVPARPAQLSAAPVGAAERVQNPPAGAGPSTGDPR